MRSDKVRFSVLRGAAVLSFGALIVKAIGAFFKIPLGNLLGGEGLSCYMSAFELFGPVYAFTAAGLPTLVARQVSAAAGDKKRLLSRYLSPIALLGFGAAVLFGLACPFLCALIGNKKAVWAALALAPTVFFGCLSGCLRGYFQGLCDMSPTAVSQLIEAVVKLFLGLAACRFALYRGAGLHIAAAAALLGVSGGSMVSFVYLRVRAGRLPRPDKKVKKLFSGALPLCLSGVMSGFCATVDLFTVTRLVPGDGAFLYGAYSGIALTLVNFLPAICTSVGVSALPGISAGYSAGTYLGGPVRALYKYTLLLAVPMGAGLSSVAAPVLNLLFGAQKEEVAAVIRPLQILCFYGILWSMVLTLFSALQAIHKEKLPLYLCAVGAVIKLVLNIRLLPLYGLSGAAIAAVCSAGAVLIYASAAVYHYTGGLPSVLHLWHIFVGSVLCCVTARVGYGALLPFLGEGLSAAACILAAGGVYFGYILLFGLIKKTELFS